MRDRWRKLRAGEKALVIACVPLWLPMMAVIGLGWLICVAVDRTLYLFEGEHEPSRGDWP